MDAELRMAIWNLLYECYLNESIPYSYKRSLCRAIWSNWLKKPLDTIPPNSSVTLIHISAWYDGLLWHEVYDFLEFCIDFARINCDNRRYPTVIGNENSIKLTNSVLKHEGSAYRIAGHQIVPITNESEIASVEETASLGGPYLAAANHTKEAFILLADRSNPSPGNIIKEAISAVESVVKAITGGEIIKGLTQLGAHSQLEQAWKNMYHWTSQEAGVRHGTGEPVTIGIEEARYMVVASSAFVNYLVSKNS